MKKTSNVNQTKTLTRRNFLNKTSRLTAASALGAPLIFSSIKAAGQSNALPEHPNFLFLITDQQRYPRHWPQGWVNQNLPIWNRLQTNGISFNRCYCNSSMCSPSRATLLTGLYPKHHGVMDTLTESESFDYHYLPQNMQNMGKMLASAGYNVHYRGKWHLSKGENQYDPTQEDIEAYGFYGWTPPDAGQDGAPENFGIRHDERFTNEAIEFLKTQSVETSRNNPFALFASLVNPHDVISYPNSHQDDFPGIYGFGFRDQSSTGHQ